jgi:hypothetical protein
MPKSPSKVDSNLSCLHELLVYKAATFSIEDRRIGMSAQMATL